MRHVYLIILGILLCGLISGAQAAIIYTPAYPPVQDIAHVNATTTLSSSFYPYFATDPTKSLTGDWVGAAWASSSVTNQKYNMDLGLPIQIQLVNYENGHSSGAYTNYGAKNYTLWGSNDVSAFLNLEYSNNTGWTQLTTNTTAFIQHVALDVADPQFISVTNSQSYRYYSFKFEDCFSGGAAIAVRRIVLETALESEWVETNSTHPSLNRHGFVQYSNGSTTYIVTGRQNLTSYKSDVIKTTDGGYTFSIVNSSIGFAVAFPWSVGYGDTIIVGQGYDGSANTVAVRKSTNGGSTWSVVNSSSGLLALHDSVAVRNSTTGKIIVMGGTNGTEQSGVYSSLDDGSTWSLVTNTPGWSAREGFAAYYTGANITIIGGYTGTAYINETWTSANDGLTWSRLSDAPMEGRYVPTFTKSGGHLWYGTGSNTTAVFNDLWYTPIGNFTGWARIVPDPSFGGLTYGAMSNNGTSLFLSGGINHAGAPYDSQNMGFYSNVHMLVPIASFTAIPSVGVAPLSLYLNDTSTGSPTSWNISWGDGTFTNQTSFPATNITHVYSTAGPYTITEYATNLYGTGSATTTITVYGPANSQFASFNTAGTAPFTTYLYDTSTNITPGPATYAWDFGDGNSSTEANTYFTWNATGTYNVTHTVSNGLSSETSFMNVTVGTPTPPAVAPVASFYGSPTTGNVPLTVFFTDVSSNTPTSWNWSFGDGAYSELQNPSHIYTRSGFRTVNLTATNSAGSNVTTRLKFVKVS
jgi:PKD repeat protein